VGNKAAKKKKKKTQIKHPYLRNSGQQQKKPKSKQLEAEQI
jgi:hypothetical protein